MIGKGKKENSASHVAQFKFRNMDLNKYISAKQAMRTAEYTRRHCLYHKPNYCKCQWCLTVWRSDKTCYNTRSSFAFEQAKSIWYKVSLHKRKESDKTHLYLNPQGPFWSAAIHKYGLVNKRSTGLCKKKLVCTHVISSESIQGSSEQKQVWSLQLYQIHWKVPKKPSICV